LKYFNVRFLPFGVDDMENIRFSGWPPRHATCWGSKEMVLGMTTRSRHVCGINNSSG